MHTCLTSIDMIKFIYMMMLTFDYVRVSFTAVIQHHLRLLNRSPLTAC